MKCYIDFDTIKNNFKICKLKNSRAFKFYSSNKTMNDYYRYATIYYDTYFNTEENFYSVPRITNKKFNSIEKNDIDKLTNLSPEFGKNKIMIFEFPEDYTEEKLFYFVMKFNAKEYKNE